MLLKTKSPKVSFAKIIQTTSAVILIGSNAISATPSSDFEKVRLELRENVRTEVLKTLNGSDGAIFIRKGDAFFRSSAASSIAPLSKRTKIAKLKPNPRLHVEEMADKITDLLMADALVGDELRGKIKTPTQALTPHMNKVDVSQLDILIRDPNYQVLQAKTVQTVGQRLDAIEKNFPDAEAKTRFSRVSCAEPTLHGGLTEYSLYDSETQTLEFCARYLPLSGDLASWEANLSPSAEREPASMKTDRDEEDFKVALAPDESIASTDTYPTTISDNGSLDLHPDLNLNGEKTASSYAGADEVHRGPASLSAAEKIRNARLARTHRRLPSKSPNKAASARPSVASSTRPPMKVVARPAEAAPRGEVHSTTSSSVAAVSGQLSSNTGIRRSQLPASVQEGFEFRLQYGHLVTTFWVVNRGTNYDLVYANSGGSRVSVGIPVTSFAYLQETAEAVHHDVNDISRCPTAKIQMHIVSEGEKEQTIAACVQGKTKAAADLRAMGNLLSTLVR